MKLLPMLLLAAVPVLAADVAPVFNGSIERLDPALDQLIAPDTRIEVLTSGFKWSEGPVWLDGRIVFSDVPKNTAFQWREGDKNASVFLQPSGATTDPTGQGSNGLAHDAKGQLILCQHGDRCIARLEKDGKFTKLAERYEGKRLNSPNDLAIHTSGSIYFTDPPYGLSKGAGKELDFNGVFRLDPDGKLVALIKDLTFPNGIALSPDEKTLYVAVSDPKDTRVMAYAIEGDKVGPGRLFFDANKVKRPDRKGGCDGLKVDTNGNIWTTGPGGVLIINPDGKHLGSLLTGQPTANCAFGGDGSVLYITSNMFLLRVRTLVKGR